MMRKLPTVLALSASALLLATAVLPPEANPLIDSAYARDGGGGGGAGGGGGSGGGGHGGGHGGGVGGGHGDGVGGGKGHGLAGGEHSQGKGQGLGHATGTGVGQGQSQGHGTTTSAAARSGLTTGLAKAIDVVASTPAAIAGALGLSKVVEAQDRDPADDVDETAD